MMKEVYIFEYEEGWMIFLYQDGKEHKYWSCAEDMWDDVWDIIYLLELPEENIYHYRMDSFEQYKEYVNDIITNESKLALEKFRVK